MVRGLVALMLVTVAVACSPGVSRGPDVPSTILVTSRAFVNGARIPDRYGCVDTNVSPPLAWSGVPTLAAEQAVTVRDPDAPGGRFFHWVLFGIPATLRKIDEGTIPPGAIEGTASTGTVGYDGPCPPPGEKAHRYIFTVWAVSRPLGLPQGAPAENVQAAIEAAAIGRGTITGFFSRPTG